MKPIDHALLPYTHITDVELFFAKITKSYLDFEGRIQHLLSNARHYSPEQILGECNKLVEQRGTLALLDKQMFIIIDMAGEEIVNTAMIYDFRTAFAKASMACNNLHQNLLVIRTTLQHDNSPESRCLA